MYVILLHLLKYYGDIVYTGCTTLQVCVAYHILSEVLHLKNMHIKYASIYGNTFTDFSISPIFFPSCTLHVTSNILGGLLSLDVKYGC